MVNRTCCPQVHTIRQSLNMLFNINSQKKARMEKQRTEDNYSNKSLIPCLGPDPEPILISGNDCLKGG